MLKDARTRSADELHRSAAEEAAMRRSLMIVIAFAVLGSAGGVESDDRPAFTNDRIQPFWLEFGRGSWWHGLDTVKFDQTGRVILHRLKSARTKSDGGMAP